MLLDRFQQNLRPLRLHFLLEAVLNLIFLEIGADKDHVHFLVQSAPNYSPAQIVKIVKSITARAVFLWGNLRFTGQVREVNVYEAAGIPGYVSASSPPHSGTPG